MKMDLTTFYTKNGYFKFHLLVLFIYLAFNTDFVQCQTTTQTCNITQVIQCGDTALKDTIQHACTWQNTIPKFDSCVYEATRGCMAVIQLEIQSWVQQLNTTIHQMNTNTAQTTSGCVHECLNDQIKKTEVDKCATTGTGLEALTQKVLAADGTNQNMNAECTYVQVIALCYSRARNDSLFSELRSIETCMLKQVGDCLDILKYINTTLERVQWLKVETICATKHVWPNTTTTDDSTKNKENDNSLDVEYVIIIVIAIVVLVAVNIVVCFVIYRERQRKERAKLLRDSTTDDRSNDPLPPYSSPDGPYVSPGSPYIAPGGYTGLYPNLHGVGRSPGLFGSRPPSYGGGRYGESPTKPFY